MPHVSSPLQKLSLAYLTPLSTSTLYNPYVITYNTRMYCNILLQGYGLGTAGDTRLQPCCTGGGITGPTLYK